MNKKIIKSSLIGVLSVTLISGGVIHLIENTQTQTQNIAQAANSYLKKINLDSYPDSSSGEIEIQLDGSTFKKIDNATANKFMKDTEDSVLYVDINGKTYWLSSMRNIKEDKKIVFTQRFEEFTSSYNDQTLSAFSYNVKNMTQKKELADNYKMVQILLTQTINGLYYQETIKSSRAIDFDRIQDSKELIELVDGNTISVLKEIKIEKGVDGVINKVVLKYTEKPEESKKIKENIVSEYNVVKDYADKIIAAGKKNKKHQFDVNPKTRFNENKEEVKVPIPETKVSDSFLTNIYNMLKSI